MVIKGMCECVRSFLKQKLAHLWLGNHLLHARSVYQKVNLSGKKGKLSSQQGICTLKFSFRAGSCHFFNKKSIERFFPTKKMQIALTLVYQLNDSKTFLDPLAFSIQELYGVFHV